MMWKRNIDQSPSICAPTRDQTSILGMCPEPATFRCIGRCSNPLSHPARANQDSLDRKPPCHLGPSLPLLHVASWLVLLPQCQHYELSTILCTVSIGISATSSGSLWGGPCCKSAEKGEREKNVHQESWWLKPCVPEHVDGSGAQRGPGDSLVLDPTQPGDRQIVPSSISLICVWPGWDCMFPSHKVSFLILFVPTDVPGYSFRAWTVHQKQPHKNGLYQQCIL